MLSCKLLILSAMLVSCLAQFQLASRYRQPHEIGQDLQKIDALSSQRSMIDWKVITQEFKRLSVENIFNKSSIPDLPLSEICSAQMLYMSEALVDEGLDNSWALDMADAWGKPAAGIRRVNLAWLGDFHECQSAHSNVTGVTPSEEWHPMEFDAQYCVVGVNVSVLMATFISEIGISVGACFPSGCNKTDILEMGRFVVGVNKTFEVDCQEKEMKLSTPAVAAIVVFSLMGGICLLGTLYEFYFIVTKPAKRAQSQSVNADAGSASASAEKEDDVEVLIPPSEADQPVERTPGALGSFLMCFSLYSNGCLILSTKQPPGSLTCIHGIRFISMLWVILGHTFVFSMNSIQNFVEVYGWIKRWSFQLITNSPVAVDSFFALSGVLGTFVLLRDMSRKNPGIKRFLISVPVAYLHRYIRLTPAYGFMLFFYATLTLYMYNSPFKPVGTDTADEFCNSTWKNLLYVSNIVDSEKQCAAWTWYLSNDFQFFLVVPFVVYLMHRKPKVGFALSILMVVASICTSIGISVYYDLGVSLLSSRDPAHPDPATTLHFSEKFYYVPWVRYQAFGVGVVFGFMIWHLKGRLPIHWIVNLVLWTVSIAMMLATVYGPLHLEDGTRVASTVEIAFYNGFSKTTWSLGLSYIILACCCGKGGWVNEFLSWPGFVPASKLTYCAYLLHPIIIIVLSAAQLEKVLWSEMTSAYMFVAYAGLSFGAAFIFSLVFEVPFAHLDKNYITGRLKSRS